MSVVAGFSRIRQDLVGEMAENLPRQDPDRRSGRQAGVGMKNQAEERSFTHPDGHVAAGVGELTQQLFARR